MGWQPYNSQKSRRAGRAMTTGELLVSMFVFVVVIGTLAVFLLVFHDIPFRAI